ncbi:MAG: DNA-processing protein DprA, partial [Clostridia bacterium]
VWRAYGHEMEPLLGEKAYRVMGDSHTPEYVRMLFDQMAHKDMIALTRQDPRYPPLLREIADPPAALFVRGCMELQDAHTLAIVGTRHCTAYGAAMAEQIGADLARAGVTVISGLARGIDGAAQRGAARAGGRTVAVLGSGVDRIYPPEHEKLAEEILAAGGSLVSEYGPDVQAWPQHFPARNRIISGMSAGVLLVEAGEKSGALITVDFAMEQNREVYALPGPANAGLSCAPHRLIREGARLVTCADDLLVDQRWPQDEAWMPMDGHASTERGGNACIRSVG